MRLGLDLQGGSQLLLQIETGDALKEKLQNLSEDIRIKLEENEIFSTDISVVNEKVKISLNIEDDIKKAEKIINDFQSLEIERDNLFLQLNFDEKYINDFYSSLVLQSLEIIRKRIDELGTNEPIIQIQGNQRILVQLPGLKDPDRIKALLGKTAKMNFRLVDEKNMQLVNEKKYLWVQKL